MPKETIGTKARQMAKLATLVAELREEEALDALKNSLAVGLSPTDLLNAFQKGMRIVGSMHEKGHYYIAGLIMAGEIMHQAVEILRPVMAGKRRSKTFGRVLLGTIEGDIHDIGKNLFRDLLECHGFTVLDLGVDVPPADFVAAESDFRPHLIAASALITDSFPHLRELVLMFEDAALRGATKRPFILIGGGQVDERVFRMCGADQWGEDAFAGIRICQRFITESKKKGRSVS